MYLVFDSWFSHFCLNLFKGVSNCYGLFNAKVWVICKCLITILTVECYSLVYNGYGSFSQSEGTEPTSQVRIWNKVFYSPSWLGNKQ